MELGKQVRINRLFSHPSGNLCSIAVDHFPNYYTGLPDGLRQIEDTLAKIVAAKPDSVTMHKGIASSLWAQHAGKVPLIIQSSGARPDYPEPVQLVTVEEAVRMGADAMAFSAFVHGSNETAYLRQVANVVRESMKYNLPIISHVYPLNKDHQVEYTPEGVAWAVRCMVEVGVDVVKAPYCGDFESQKQIAATCPVPLVAAGGPKAETMRDALDIMSSAVKSGVRGGTVGRNVWSSPHVGAAVAAYKAVIHDLKDADEAVKLIPA